MNVWNNDIKFEFNLKWISLVLNKYWTTKITSELIKSQQIQKKEPIKLSKPEALWGLRLHITTLISFSKRTAIRPWFSMRSTKVGIVSKE